MRVKTLFCVSLIATAQFVCLVLLPTSGNAQHLRACTGNVQMTVTPSVSAQGSLLQVELKSASPISEVTGEWVKHPVSFWRDDNTNTRRAILGVDLELPTGKHILSVTVRLAGGQAVNCSAPVSVHTGQFAVERLRVAPKFVEPNQKDLERVEHDQQQVKELLAKVSALRLWDGRFRFPLDTVRRGGNFGKRRILNGEPRSPHTGLDIPAPTGTPVRATQTGRVVLAEDLFFSGNTVVIDHGLGVFTFYGHLSSMAVNKGDMISAGALLGRVGATGRVTGPHLHWGLIVNQARVNPLQLLALSPRQGNTD